MIDYRRPCAYSFVVKAEHAFEEISYLMVSQTRGGGRPDLDTSDPANHDA